MANDAARKGPRKPATNGPTATAEPATPTAVPAAPLGKPEIKKIQDLLTSKTADGVAIGLSLLESLGATRADYEAVFKEAVITAVLKTWNAKTLLATAQALLPHKDVCQQFITAAAERFCKVPEADRLRLLHGLFQQPFCFDAWHANPAEHRLDLDVSDGTILWDVLHRELCAAERVKMQYRESQEEGLSVCIVHSLNGIHLAGYQCSPGRSRPAELPIHVVQSSGLDSRFPDKRGWFEVAWAVSFGNLIGRVLARTTDIWDGHDWCWDKGEHVIIAMLWSWFSAECLAGTEITQIDRCLGHESTPLRNRKILFGWTDKGSKALVAYTNTLLRHRKFIDPSIGSVFEAWPNSPYLPWQDSEASWENEFEARFREQKQTYASYESLSDELQQLAYYAAIAVRDAAQRIKPLTNGVPVIEGLANHTLICLALHPASPQGIVNLLADDVYEPVASAATSGRSAKSDQRSSADKMKELVDYVVRGTGGRSRAKDVPDSTLAVAKRLSRYWTRWKKEDSLDNVDAVNTKDPRANENRMRAVAIGVAVTRGWIAPTKEGVSLMNKYVVDLDAPPSGTTHDINDDDD